MGCRVELFYADLRLYSIRIQNILTAEFYVYSVTTSGDRLLILGTGYIDSIGTGFRPPFLATLVSCELEYRRVPFDLLAVSVISGHRQILRQIFIIFSFTNLLQP